MTQVNMLDAKTRLSSLVAALESGEETEIVLARNGRPAARLVPLESKAPRVRLGLAKGQWTAPADPHSDNDYIERLFYGDPEEA